MPEYIWLACGSLNNLSRKRTEILKGRKVVLFPDLGCFDLWNAKVSKLTPLANFTVSKLLRDNATAEEKKEGLDIADYLIKLDVKV